MRKTQIQFDLSSNDMKVLKIIAETREHTQAESMRQLMLELRELELHRSVVSRIASTAGEQLGVWWWRISNSQPNAVLIRALLPPELAEDIIANLEHHYETVWLHKHCARIAKLIFYTQNLRVVLSHYVGAIQGALEAYFKLSK